MSIASIEAADTVRLFHENRRGNPNGKDRRDADIYLAYLQGRTMRATREQAEEAAMILHGYDIRDGIRRPESWGELDKATRGGYLDKARRVLDAAMLALTRPTIDGEGTGERCRD